jgi:organic radical activating enzyme
MFKDQFDIDIDICGACTLRCPSCPQGNVKDYRLPQGFMDPELLTRIVAKAQSECRRPNISLFNWAEPLLHPQLPELVGIIQKAGIPCHLSSNLDILPDADALMAANPATLRISASGFTQEVYGRTHRGGDIERVKKHMVALAAAKKRNRADTDIFVHYHRYRHNLHDEPRLREFAKGLGFHFHAVWALFFPLEKLLAYAGEELDDFPLTEEDMALIDSLALPMRAALAAARKYRNRPCSLREDAISLDFQGNATLCCGVFDARKYSVANYLEIPLEEIQKVRRSHPLCNICMGQGVHVFMTYGIKEMDELALANITPGDIELLDLRDQLTWERRQQRLSKLYDRLFSKILSTEQKAVLVGRFKRVQNFLRKFRR